MLEITREVTKYNRDGFVLKLNGEVVCEDISSQDNGKFIINLYDSDDKESIHDILNDDLDFLVNKCSKIEFIIPDRYLAINEDFFHDSATLEFHDYKLFKLSICVKINLMAWVNEWSGRVHLLEFKRILDSFDLDAVSWDNWTDNESDIYDNDFWKTRLVFLFDGYAHGLESELSSALNLINKVHEKVSESLNSRFNVGNNSVLTQFEFPDEIKVGCEQYLLYFVKFLKDVGIDATANIQDAGAGKVLFSVTPKDKQQALSQIIDALEIYLNLPRNSSIIPFDVQADVSVQQLVSNIYHLKSQLALAATMIQQKELLISQQQAMINNQLLNGEILVKSMQQMTTVAKGDEKENVIGDIIAVRKADWGFVQVDLPTLMRRLKQVFGKGNRE